MMSLDQAKLSELCLAYHAARDPAGMARTYGDIRSFVENVHADAYLLGRADMERKYADEI